MSNGIAEATAPWAALVLRLTLGVALLAHSLYLKVFVFTMPGTVQFFASLGLPAVMAWAVLVTEIAAGAMLISGWQTRVASLATAPVLAGAIWAHAGNGWMFAGTGGGWEYPLFWMLALVVQALLGPGAMAVGSLRVAQSGLAFRLRAGH